MEITRELAEKVLYTVDAGLVRGLGTPQLGAMCVEAAVCYALGEPHSDRPSCVAPTVGAFQIGLNDARWSSNMARAAGMRKLAVAQLGSAGVIDEARFAERLVENTIRRLLPFLLGRLPKQTAAIKEAIQCCAQKGDVASARAAARAVDVTDAVDAVDAAANAAVHAAVHAATYVVYTATAVDAAGHAARAAVHAAAYVANAADEVLRLSADIGLEALQFVKSPGVQFLFLCD